MCGESNICTMTPWFWICSFLASWVYIHREKVIMKPYREWSQMTKPRKDPFLQCGFPKTLLWSIFHKALEANQGRAWRLYLPTSQGASIITAHCQSLGWTQCVVPWVLQDILQCLTSHSCQAMGFKHMGSISGGHSTQHHSWRINSRPLFPPPVSLTFNSSRWLGRQCPKDSCQELYKLHLT